MKVTFKSSETVDKFIKGAKEAGFLGSRTVVNKGKYQGAKTVADLPKFYIRPSTTMEERLRFKERQQKRTKHEKTPDYARWLGVKTRDKEFTHNNVGENENDLNEAWFLKPEDFPTIISSTEQTTTAQAQPKGGGSGVDSTGEKDDHIQDNEKVNALSNGKDLGVTVNPKGVKRGRTDSPPKLAKSSSSQNPEEQEENNADPPIDLPAEESSA